MASCTPPRHVLVLRAAGLGDLLTVVPALRALRRMAGDDPLVLAAPTWLSPVVALTDAVDVLVHATAALDRLPGLVDGARLAVNLHGAGPQSTALLAATEPRGLLAFAPSAFRAAPEQGPRWDPEEHEVARWCRLLRDAEIAVDPTDLGLRVPDLDLPMAWRGVTVLHLGASSPARQWPVSRWTALARALGGRHRPLVLTGSTADRPAASAVAEAAGLGQDAVLAGSTDLTTVAALVAHAGCVVSGDTGIAHLASAYRTPSVVLFGPVPPSRWGPPGDGPHRALWSGTFGDPHGSTTDPGLARITAAEVVDAVHSLDIVPSPVGRS